MWRNKAIISQAIKVFPAHQTQQLCSVTVISGSLGDLFQFLSNTVQK